jgi:hypothetical protein
MAGDPFGRDKIALVFLCDMRITDWGWGFKPSKAAKRGWFFAGSGKPVGARKQDGGGRDKYWIMSSSSVFVVHGNMRISISEIIRRCLIWTKAWNAILTSTITRGRIKV